MGFGSFFKKISHGAGNFFHKVEHGASNVFKKAGGVVNKLPSIANQVGNTVRTVANEIQKKSDIIAPIVSAGAMALGQPEIAAGIMAGQQAIKQGNSMIQSRTGKAVQAISTGVQNYNNQVGNLSNQYQQVRNNVLLPQ